MSCARVLLFFLLVGVNAGVVLAAIGGRGQEEVAAPPEALYDQSTLQIYQGSESVVDWPLEKVRRLVPELKGLQPAESQQGLGPLLEKVGANADAFFKNFTNTASVEEIRQSRQRADGKGDERVNERFRYLLLATPHSSGFGLQEYRADLDGKPAENAGAGAGFLLTRGFASAGIYFVTGHQPESDFRLLGRQILDGHDTLVVAFAQRPGHSQAMSRFGSGDNSIPVLVQGVAWIESVNCQIVRLRTDLLAPQAATNLEKLMTEVNYEEVHFKQPAVALWLPSRVRVEVRYKGHEYHNEHRYTGYQLFSVQTQQTVGESPTPQP